MQVQLKYMKYDSKYKKAKVTMYVILYVIWKPIKWN